MQNYLKEAQTCLKNGNLAQAEQLCREHLDKFEDDPMALSLLGDIAFLIKAHTHALEYYRRAFEKMQSFEAQSISDKINIVLKEKSLADESHSNNKKKYLLIKAWGYGFWSDMDHVLGQLFLAEMTKREPVVYWGKNSLYRSRECDNAFELCFERVASSTIQDIIENNCTFYPPKWRKENLFEENISKFSGPYSRIAGLYALHRDEDVVVSDFYSRLFELIPWLDRGSEYYGKGLEYIYHRIFTKYIRLKPHLQEMVQEFWEQRMQYRKWVAVHVRGSDKKLEMSDLDRFNIGYYAHLEKLLGADPHLSIFLLTDSEPILNDYLKRYGPKILFTESARVSGDVGVHYSGFPGNQIAKDVILDTYLAARCDYFLGNGQTNLSRMVSHLKRWDDGHYMLLGKNRSYLRNLFIHRNKIIKRSEPCFCGSGKKFKHCHGSH